MRLLLILSFIFLTNQIFSKCGGSSISFWPEGKTIQQNQLIIIEGYHYNEDIIGELNKKYPIFLISGNQKIKLQVKEINRGDFRLNQAILIPEMSLTVGIEYTCVVENLPENLTDIFKKWNSDSQRYESVTWTVSSSSNTDIEKPMWIKKPVEINKRYVQYGCGPGIHIDFKYEVKDASDVLIKTSVTNIKTKKSTTFYFPADHSNTLSIGHGMCSGAFEFEGEKYEITFDLVDIFGNQNAWDIIPITFTKPTIKNTK